MEARLYLAGPITGLSYGESTDWRAKVAGMLPPHIRPISPMRGKVYLLERTSIKDAYDEEILGSKKAITCRDRNDVRTCDMLLVNFLGAPRVSIGTVMEIAWADAYRKPIVIVMEKDLPKEKANPHDHAMIREVAGFIVPTLEDAVVVAKAVFSEL